MMGVEQKNSPVQNPGRFRRDFAPGWNASRSNALLSARELALSDGFGMVLERQFATPDLHVRRRFEPKSDLPALDLEDRHHDAVTDHNALADLAAQYQHGVPPSWTQGHYLP